MTRLIFILFISISSNLLNGQAYFKTSGSIDLLDQKVAEFSSGDLLIGNSSTAPVRSGDETGILLLSRVDYCGNIVWSKEYNYGGGYLILKDIAVNSRDEIFLFGSHYKGLTESLFVAKIEDAAKSDLDLRIFSPGSVDHFTYSIDANDDKLLVYGLLLDFNSSKEGFMGLFDHNLNFIKASKFVPFESSGNAIISDNDEVIARSGPYVYKFDNDGEVDWVFNTVEGGDVLNIGGPFLGDNGWIYEAHSAGSSFLYMIDKDRKLLWKSALIEASNQGGDLSQLDNGNLLFVYNRGIDSGSELCFLLLDRSGRTIAEKKLVQPYSVNTGRVIQRVKDKDINIIGSKNLFAPGNIELENFILQFTLDDVVEDCYSFDDLANTRFNDIDLKLEELSIDPTDFEFQIVDRVKIRFKDIVGQLGDLCNLGQEIIPTVETKLLPCIDNWDVTLPGVSFIWDDGHPTIDRSLSLPGIYTARSIDCDDQEVIEYQLEKEECGCKIYLPNVFSPGDGISNNELQLGIFCELESLDLSIYNKWGERVFTSNSVDRFWQGKIRLVDAPAGVYSALVDYSWIDASGTMQQEKIIQTVTLLR